MRRLLLPALAVLMMSVAGCGPEPASPPPAPRSPAPSPSAAPVPSRAPSASAVDPENPRDPIGPPVVLTGTVGRRHGCVVLTTGGRRWALIGPAANRMADGQRVTVRGRPIAVPAGCMADFAVLLRPAPGK